MTKPGKYTKWQYKKDLAAVEAKIVAVEAKLKAFDEEYEKTGLLTEDMEKNWNPAHDELWNLNEDLRSIERQWSRRNWTGQDYAFHDLVMQNID